MTIRRQPTAVRVASDLFTVFFAASIATADALVLFALVRDTRGGPDVVLGAIALLATHVLVIAVLRVFVPPPPEGAHLVRPSGGYLRWLASSALTEVALHPLVRAPFWSFHFGRWIYLRALGAQLEPGITIPANLSIRDPGLLVVESGAQLEPGVLIEPVFHAAGRLIVGRVVIGGGSLVGAHAVLLAGSAIGEDARVGVGAFIGRGSKVGVGAFIGERAVLEETVDVGSYAVIGTGAVVAAGVSIGERSKVVAGSSVPTGSSVEDRDVWLGAPSIRVETFEPPTPPVPLPVELLLREDLAARVVSVDEAPRPKALPREDTDQVRDRQKRAEAREREPVADPARGAETAPPAPTDAEGVPAPSDPLEGPVPETSIDPPSASPPSSP
ncbi:MAG: hypothetical protein HYV07_14800 [Deltaproteobacteria bacterium]|nr:hypothetical protein [Deltaproteobacteria bacterium]